MPKTIDSLQPDELPKVTEAALAALRVLKNASRQSPMSAKGVARMLWPDRIQDAGTSLRRGGLYRSAGGFCAKLMRRGLVGQNITDFDAGYYLTELGTRVLAEHTRTSQEEEE